VALVTYIPAGSQARRVDWAISPSQRPHSSKRGREPVRNVHAYEKRSLW